MVLVERPVQHGVGVGVEPGEDLLVGPRHPGGGFPQALPVGVLPHRDQQLAHRCLRPRPVHDRWARLRGGVGDCRAQRGPSWAGPAPFPRGVSGDGPRSAFSP